MASSSRRIPQLLVFCALVLPVGVAAAATGANEELDEVAVIGKSLRELRREVTRAEDRFYKRFNTLNTNDDFDIHCRMDKATGTRVPKRQCRIRFLVETETMDSQEFFRGLTNGGPGVHTPLAPLQTQWILRRDEYRQTARALLEKDTGLLALANEWLRVQEQYNRVRNERQQNGSIVFK